jgi:protein-disulfide isomerase
MIVAGALIYTDGTKGGENTNTAAVRKVVAPSEVPIFTKCLENGDNIERIDRDFNDGVKIKVQGTPYGVMWNKTSGTQVPIGGAYPLDAMKEMLKQAMTGPMSTDTPVVPEEILTIKADDHVFGNPNANIVIIEYSDLECPFCIRFHATMHQLMALHKEQNDIAWVYRHFPLSIHPNAMKEAEATECVYDQGGNEMFWKYIDRSFSITPGNNQLDPAEMYGMAKFVGAK